MAESGKPPYEEVAFSGIKGGGEFRILQSRHSEHPYGGTVRHGTVQGHIAGRATRAALCDSARTCKDTRRERKVYSRH